MRRLFMALTALSIMSIDVSAFAWTRLAWEPPVTGGPVDGYHVWVGTTSGSGYEQIGEVTGTQFQRTEIEAAIDTISETARYYFVVSAFNELGDGPISNEVSSPLALPGIPGGLLKAE